jgi:hypothetical protein
VDHVAARLPEGLAGADNAFGLALQLEDHFALDHVAEGGAGVSVGVPRTVIASEGSGTGGVGTEPTTSNRGGGVVAFGSSMWCAWSTVMGTPHRL